MATGSENVNAAIDNLVNSVVPALKARVLALIVSINTTAAEGLTGPQTEAHLTALQDLADDLTTVGENPTQPIALQPLKAMPAPLIGGANMVTHTAGEVQAENERRASFKSKPHTPDENAREQQRQKAFDSIPNR